MQKTKAKERFKWFRRNGSRKVHRQIKDRLFRFLFEKDKEALFIMYPIRWTRQAKGIA